MLKNGHYVPPYLNHTFTVSRTTITKKTVQSRNGGVGTNHTLSMVFHAEIGTRNIFVHKLLYP